MKGGVNVTLLTNGKEVTYEAVSQIAAVDVLFVAIPAVAQYRCPVCTSVCSNTSCIDGLYNHYINTSTTCLQTIHFIQFLLAAQ